MVGGRTGPKCHLYGRKLRGLTIDWPDAFFLLADVNSRKKSPKQKMGPRKREAMVQRSQGELRASRTAPPSQEEAGGRDQNQGIGLTGRVSSMERREARKTSKCFYQGKKKKK